ncbi:MAG: GntR family transcriptional regulator [Chitinophagaceae bacterium]|nr:GntR family transcriptional regulator [Chitinophagaceae bacterium]
MKLAIDHNSPVPLHVQVENLLRELIRQPQYQQGELLPGETQLASVLGISRNTLRQATNKLEYEGLLIRKKGIGTRVKQQAVTSHLEHWHSFTQEMNEQGVSLVVYEQRCETVAADARLAAFFHVQEGEPVFSLKRLRGSHHGPLVYFESYFHPRIGINANDDFSRPLYDILEQDYHVVPALSKENISARPAKASIAAALRIKKGAPILYRERFVFDPGGRPVEYNTGCYRADRFTYSIDIRRS